MNQSEHWHEYFEETFADSDPWSYETSEYERTKYARQIRVADDHLDDIDRILELGCSEGVHSELLVDSFPEATLLGISISEQEVERARERVPERARFVAADATEHVHELSGSFDLIVWSETMYYMGDVTSVPEMCDLVETVCSYLTADGVLVAANIVGQSDPPEARLTRPEVLTVYRSFLESAADPIHYSQHEERKAESGNTHVYELWAYRAAGGDP